MAESEEATHTEVIEGTDGESLESISDPGTSVDFGDPELICESERKEEDNVAPAADKEMENEIQQEETESEVGHSVGSTSPSQDFSKEETEEMVVVNEGEVVAVNNDEMVAVKESEMVAVKESEMVTVNEGEAVTVNEGEAVTVNEGEAVTVNESEVVTVNDGEAVVVNDGEMTPVNDGDVALVNDGEIVTVNDGEPGSTSESEKEVFEVKLEEELDLKEENAAVKDDCVEKSPGEADISEEIQMDTSCDHEEEKEKSYTNEKIVAGIDTKEEDSREQDSSSSLDCKLRVLTASSDLDEMMDIGTVDQVDQEAQMKEEEDNSSKDTESSRSPAVSNTVADDSNSVKEETDVKPTASDLMQSSSSQSSEATTNTGRESSSPATMLNGMKVVKLSIPRLDFERLRHGTQRVKASPSPPLVTVKDEPVDEEYEQALISSSSTASVKDEPNIPKEDLRIGSVFSVTSDTQTLPVINPSSLHMSCAHCKKSLMKGQTAFQRKGSPALFCSTTCLTTSLPLVKGPAKICHNCQKLIIRPQDVILAPDFKGLMKDFCSQNCLTSFNYKKNASNYRKIPVPVKAPQPVAPQSLCSMCTRYCLSKHEVILGGTVHKMCSDACFNRFRTVNNLSMAGCATCGSYCHNKPLMLKMEESSKTVCNQECLAKYKEKTKITQPCTMCRTTRFLADMVDNKNSDDSVNLFCSSSCVMAFKVQTVSSSGARINCDNCGKVTVPSYHLAMSDTSIRNFCALPCVMAFQGVVAYRLPLDDSQYQHHHRSINITDIMPKKNLKNAAKKSPGRKEEPSSSSRSPCDGDNAGSNTSRASLAASMAYTYSQPSLAKRKRAKKTQFCLDVEEEQLMCDFLRENAILWNIKKIDYRRVDKKAKLWKDQAKAMGRTVEHLQGWFKSLRDNHTRLDKRKSGDSTQELTEREQWVKANFGFLKTVVRHRAEPVNSVKATIAEHSRDLEAADAACADIMIDDDSMPSPISSSSLQRKGKRGPDDDQLLQSLQKRVHKSGNLVKGLAQPQPITATTVFANYVHDSLISMSKRKFQKARSRINTVLAELMDEESDEEDSPRVTTFPAPASVPPSSASATHTPTVSEMYQPLSHMWRCKTPAASVWGSQTADCVDQSMQQSLQPQYQQQQPRYQRMMPAPHQHGFQPPSQITQQLNSASVYAALGSVGQVLNQSPSALETSSQSLCGLSGTLNLSSDLDAASSLSGELKIPAPPEKN